MAYICEKETKCNDCKHFRFDGDRQRYACFAQKDEETKRHKQIDTLKYPLKLVSASYEGTYEECDMRSYGDPEQGFYKTYWKN